MNDVFHNTLFLFILFLSLQQYDQSDVCDNARLQSFVADQLGNSEKQTYTQNMKEVHEASATDGKDVVLKEHKLTSEQTVRKNRVKEAVVFSCSSDAFQ